MADFFRPIQQKDWISAKINWLPHDSEFDSLRTALAEKDKEIRYLKELLMKLHDLYFILADQTTKKDYAILDEVKQALAGKEAKE